jgi:hypothetical protein
MANDLVQKYSALKATHDRISKEADEALDESRNVLGKILAEHGKGPHLINGERVIIIHRRGCYQLMAEGGPRGKAKKSVRLGAVEDSE